jgi:hypothetical protein
MMATPKLRVRVTPELLRMFRLREMSKNMFFGASDTRSADPGRKRITYVWGPSFAKGYGGTAFSLVRQKTDGWLAEPKREGWWSRGESNP